MPQDPNLIVSEFKKILAEERAVDAARAGPPLTQEQRDRVQKKLLLKMDLAIKKLASMKKISPECAENARNAIIFYRDHTKTLSSQSHPIQLLSEICAIDYSQPVKIRSIKPGRVLTQMQAPYSPGTVGSFYTEGVLPSDFKDRASKSGIGLIASTASHEHDSKSVYISTTSEECKFLQSSAAPAIDSWSDPEFAQQSSGGGLQFRIATNDYTKLKRFGWGELSIRKSASAAGGKLLRAGVVRDGNISERTPSKRSRGSSRTR